MAVGQRPISNTVDVTNYVMLELGQPLHAFDMDLLEGGLIRVAPAEDGMVFTTLDNQERKLTKDDILIWDGVKPVALGGVMGGANSEIHAKSSQRVSGIRGVQSLECITAHVTATGPAQRGRLPPGARRGPARVAHGTVNRAAALIAELGGGTMLPGVVKDEPRPWKNRTISFRPQRAVSLLGVDSAEMDEAFCRKTMTNMGCKDGRKTRARPGRWRRPSHRLDLEREVDIIEELGRMYGLDRIEPTLPRIDVPMGRGEDELSEYRFWKRIRNWARGVGLCEAVNYSFVGDVPTSIILSLPQGGPHPGHEPALRGPERAAHHPGARGSSIHCATTSPRAMTACACSRWRTFSWADAGVRHHGARAQPPWACCSTAAGIRRGSGPSPRKTWIIMDLKGLVEHLLAFPCTLTAPEFRAVADSEPWLSRPSVEVHFWMIVWPGIWAAWSRRSRTAIMRARTCGWPSWT